MKNLNLIKRLWTDSHEKQTPQRFARYAAMLLLLLTCVTHAWAKDVYAVNLNLPGGGSNTYCHNWGSSGTSWPGTKMSKWSTMKAGSNDIYTCALKNAGNTNCIFSANGSNQTADLSFNSKYPQPTYANGSWWYSPRLTSAIWGSAHNVKGGYLYFDNTNAQWSDTYMYLVAGHDTWIQYWRLTKIDHTKLYSCNITNANWEDAKFMAIMGNSSSETTGSSQNTSPNTLVNKNHFSDALSQALTSGNTYMVSMTSGTNCTPISVASQTTGYSYYNHAQTVYKYTSTDNGSSYSAASINSGTVTITPYKLTAQGTASNSSNTGTINTAGTTSVSKDAVFTGEVTLIASANTGYTFVGWFESASGGSAISTNTTYTYNAPNTTKAIYARFKENRYSLTFSHNGHGTISVGGSTVASGSTAYVNYSTTKTLVATPNTGYNFSGWTKSGSNTGSVTIGNAANASTTIKATNTGATITAGFTPKTTTITFDKQSGTGGSDGVTATYDAAMPDITPPTRDGYTFGGYYGAPGGSGPHYYNADGSSAATWNNENATYTLHAKWTENKSSISLVASPTGKGSFTIGGAAATSTTAGVATTRSVTAVPISGYHFVSWSITGGATISGSTDNPVTVTGDGTGTAATLTATFAADAASYTITYGVGTDYTSYGTVSEGHSYPSGSSQTSGTEISLTATPTNAHYKLEGWYTTAACATPVAGADTNNPYEFTLGANTSVYAKFILKQCTITLNKNGGSTGASSVTASHGSTLPSFTAHSRTGYTLQGYYTDPSAGTKIINADGSLVASTSYADASNQWDNDATTLTLYSHWTAKQSAITFDKNGGATGDNGTTGTYDVAMTTITPPTRTGYTFDGYWDDESNNDGTGTKYYNANGTSARNWDKNTTSATTLYAKWNLNTYTITYNNMTGATASNPANYNVTTPTITLQNPTKTGYTFGGWYTDSGLNTPGNTITLGSTGNKTFWAKWTANTYDITYVDANSVATIAANPSTGSTDATINFTVTMKPGFKSLSVTAVDASSNTVAVTNPSSNNYRFTMPASAVTVTVSATALPIVYVLKTKHASSSLGDGATGLPATGQIWAWKASGSNNFYTSPGEFPGPSASSKATAITDDIIGDEWYRFIPDNISQFDGSTAYHVILTNSNRILDTQSTFIENESSHVAATHTGTIWVVPHGTDANSAYLYTSYPDRIATPYNVTYNAGDHGDLNVFGNTVTSGNSRTISTTRNRTLTASPISGYAFNRWITTGGVSVADATSATTTVTASGTGTITATYFEEVNSGWYIKGNPAGNNWDTPTTHPLNRVLPGETNVYYRSVTLPANDQYFRFWNDDGNSTQYGASSNNLAVTKGTKYNLNYNNGNAFKYSAGGTVWFVVDASGATKKFWLQDPVEFYSVNFGYSDGCKTFSAKDGEGNDLVSGNTYVSGTALTFTQTKKDGYTFVGWNTAADGSGSSLGTGSSYTVASLSADVNVYAIYTENKTAITINTDGHGTITTPSPNNSPYSLGVATTQAINASASTGYHWNTWTVSGTAALVSSASTQSNTAKGNGTDGGTGTVTATFAPNTYRVQFHRNGASEPTVYQNFTYDVAQNLTTNTYTRTGYTFAGWATSTSGEVVYANGANVSNLTSENGATFHLYAKWTPNTYTVSFDVNGGTASTPDSKNVTYDAAYGTLPGGMTHTSKQFIGWYTDPDDGEGTHITAETIVSTAENHTLYAHYENVYSVNVNFKCGEVTLYPSTKVTASASSLTPEITAPEILGYTFSNWTGTNVTPANASSATTTITATASTTITANYTAVPTVYFKNNLGWENVYVTFDSYWKEAGGKQVPGNKDKPYYKMTQIGSSDVYYCVIPETYTASDYAGWAWNIAFDNTNYGSTAETTHTGTYDPFYGGKFTGRGDFDPKATMFIPYNGDTETRNGGTFYKSGCWMKYNSTESGYQVKMNEYVTGEHAEYSTTNLTAPAAGGYEFSAIVNLPKANYSYGFKLYKEYQKNTNDLWYTNTGGITHATDDLPWAFWSGSSITSSSQRCGLHTEALGNYKITVSFATGKPMVSVEYPVSTGDWKLIYKDLATWSGVAHTASWNHPSRVIKAKENTEDIVSFYVAYGSSPSIELYKCTAIDAGTGAETWTKQSDVSLTGISKKSVYNFKVSQNGSKVATVTLDGEYDGNFYIRTDASNGGWTNYKTSGKNLMTYSEYSLTHGGDFGPYSHYFMRFASKGTNIKFCIANEYSEAISDTVVSDTYTNEYIDADGNVRFMWNSGTNKIGRTYISGSSIVSDRFLVLEGDEKMYDENGNELTTGQARVSGLNEYEMNFADDQNWIYEATVKAKPGARIKLTAKYNNKIQYFYGEEGDRSDATTDVLIGGEGTDKYKMRIVYDFKTNRLMRAFIPDGTITTDLAINADMMIIREHQQDAHQISFSGDGALSEVKTVYGAMKFNKYTVNGKSKESGHAETRASRYERDLFYISFPFDVKLGDAFGFGEYGKHWIIEYYDGKGRAEKGFWADSKPNWKFVMPAERNSFTMKAFEGYILALELDEMTESSSVWDHGVEDVYVYFPSDGNVNNIAATNRQITIDQTGYECTINRNTPDGNRTVKDSYWHCIGVPSFANYSRGLTVTDGGATIDWSDDDGVIDWTTPSLPYLYAWNSGDNSLSVTTSATFDFKATWSYLVQYAGTSIYWSQVNVTPASIVARERTAPTNAEFRIELQQGGEKADQTFVRLTEEENVTTGFDFNYDLSKEYNKNRANIYTMVTTVKEGDASVTQSAANVLPMSDQTTVVPVGVKIATTGDYTFAIPEGTAGVGVTLIDNETGIRTSLSALDYTINLSAGTYENRFVLEISPIKQMPTDIESVSDQHSAVRKVMIDGILYIVKDGKVFDAHGNRVK